MRSLHIATRETLHVAMKTQHSFKKKKNALSYADNFLYLQQFYFLN